jgi:ferritin
MNVNKEEKIVKKLIAEEFLAWQIYNQYVWSAAPDVVK